MKKMLVVLLSMLSIVVPVSSLIEFESVIQEGYLEYEVLSYEDNIYYTLQVVWGKINKNGIRIGYGIFLENKTNDRYEVVISDRFFSRNLVPNSRGDTIAHYFEIKNLTNPKLTIFNRGGNVMYTMDLPTVKSVAEYNQKILIANLGLNNPDIIEKTELAMGIKSYYSILIGATLLIFLSLIALAFILLRKLSLSKDSLIGVRPRPTNYFGSRYTENDKEQDVFASYSKVKNQKYDFDQDYDCLSPQEKQKRMAELMRMFNNGEISIDQLNNELRRLW